jgi:hypothetical protein
MSQHRRAPLERASWRQLVSTAAEPWPPQSLIGNPGPRSGLRLLTVEVSFLARRDRLEECRMKLISAAAIISWLILAWPTEVDAACDDQGDCISPHFEYHGRDDGGSGEDFPTGPSPADQQRQQQERQEEASNYAANGIRAFNAGNYIEAYSLFDSAAALNPSQTIVGNLYHTKSLIEFKNGRLVHAVA